MYHIEQGKLGALLGRKPSVATKLGVSHPILDEIVTHCINQGCLGAKMAGSGGGGIVFAYVRTEEKQIEVEFIERMGYDAFPLTLSSIREERHESNSSNASKHCCY